jgi:hypothetical protein
MNLAVCWNIRFLLLEPNKECRGYMVLDVFPTISKCGVSRTSKKGFAFLSLLIEDPTWGLCELEW